MSAKFGSDNIMEVRFGNNRITKVYFGPTLVYDRPYVKLTFHFDNSGVNPSGKLGKRAKDCGAEWLSTSDPQVWQVKTPLFDKVGGNQDSSVGIAKLFCAEGEGEPGVLLQSVVGTCQVTDITGDINRIETLDRVFNNCTAITSVSTAGFYSKFANSTTLTNVNSICNGNTGITDGSSLAGYNVLKTIQSINTHAATFKNADSAANLDQIPSGWGGTQVPQSTLMTSAVEKWFTNYDTWKITGNEPDWTDMMGVYILTTSSVSKFDGVSMNRSRIKKINGLGTTQGTDALYFYPCFMQHSSTAVTWAVMTQSPNGSLTASEGSRDMSGTLDYTTYGPFAHEFGTYDSTQDVYFTFFVTNVTIDNWNGLSDKYGILYNANYNADAGLRWLII